MKIYHNPPHIYIENTVYMITGHTYGKNNYINNSNKKEILINKVIESIEKFQFKLYGWVILDNHYHILIKIYESINLSKFINTIHGSSSFEINKIDNSRGRKIWYSYWDTCIRSEKDFYTRLNYIHCNPIKHGYITQLEQLDLYEFSSYSDYVKVKGKEWVDDIFMKFPIIDFTDDNDEKLLKGVGAFPKVK